MTLRRYSNLAAPVVLTEAINAAALTLTVGSTSGFPDPPFILGVDRGTVNEEVMLCTDKTSTTFTVTRGYDQTTAKAHDIGALVEHTVSATVYREAGIPRMNTATRDALAGVDLWVGRVIYNTDSSKLQIWMGSAWINVGPRTGAIEAYGGATAPLGTLLCNGQAVSRSTYADLFAVIGTTFGPGNGSTTFNVPDLRGRFPLGKADSGTGDELGETGGQIDHTHTGPSHTHTNPNTGSAGSHTHSVGNTGSGGNHSHSQGSTGSSSVSHTHQLRFEQVGTNDFVHISTADVGALGTSSPFRHEAGSDPDTDSGSGTSHSHSNPDTNMGGSHTHSNPNTSSSGNHAHSQGNTGASGTGSTGEANPPFLAVNYIIYT